MSLNLNRKKCFSFIPLIAVLLFSQGLFASPLLLEIGVAEQVEGLQHAKEMQRIMMANDGETPILYSGFSYNQDFWEIATELVKDNRFSLVNMSFGFETSDTASVNVHGVATKVSLKELYGFDIRGLKDRLSSIISQNPKTLFVTAAANGVSIGPFTSKGVPIGFRYEVYPAIFQFDNLISVGALNTNKIEINNLDAYRLIDSSNFGFDHVDTLAPSTDLDPNDRAHRGTSHATAYVSNVAQKIITRFKGIPSHVVKKVILRSSYIKNIRRLVTLTQEYINTPESSLIYKIHTIKKRKERERLQEQIGNDFFLVKSGGILVPEIANRCIKIAIEKKTDLNTSCAQAHMEILKTSAESAQILKKYWEIRNL